MDHQCPSFDIEKDCLEKGSMIIAGVDEAGRGALAGPLYIGIVIFSAEITLRTTDDLSFIKDSKKISPGKRMKALEKLEAIAQVCMSYSVSAEVVDSLNVNQATLHAIESAFETLDILPDAVLLDGNFNFNTKLPIHSVIGGDSLSFSIAAASIVAKVHRDMYMMNLADSYPRYGFEKNMGYGTADHRAAIQEHGPSPFHRYSYEPVRSQYADRKQC